MTAYVPDRWVVIELKSSTETVYKVLASWYGGYTGSDSWKLSSGITSIDNKDDVYEFHNYSGSVYTCHKQAYGMSMYTTSIYDSWEKQNSDEIAIRVLDEQEVEQLKLSS